MERMCPAAKMIKPSTPVCNEAGCGMSGRQQGWRRQATEESSRVSPNENSMPPMRRVPSKQPCNVSCAQRPPVSSARDIRMRFLNRLGIQKEAPQAAIRPTCRQPVTFIRNRKCSDDASTSSSSTGPCSYLSSSYSSSSTSNKSVSFDESVTVRPIPRVEDYPVETKNSIWSRPEEIYANATRNSIEFAADNFDWQHAAEEEDFVPTESGDLVHPIHYLRACNMQRNFLLVMAARHAACR